FSSSDPLHCITSDCARSFVASSTPALFHKCRRFTRVPGIVGLCEENSVVERRMIVEPDSYGGGRRGLGQIDFAQNLESLCGHLRRISHDSMYHFEAVLIRLML